MKAFFWGLGVALVIAVGLFVASATQAQIVPPSGFSSNGQPLVTQGQYSSGPAFTLLSQDTVTGVDGPGCGVSSPCKSIQYTLNQVAKGVGALDWIRLDGGDNYCPPTWTYTTNGSSHLQGGLPSCFAINSFWPEQGVGIVKGTGYGPEYPSDGGTVTTVLDTTSIMPKLLIEGQMGVVVDGGVFLASSGSLSNSLITINQLDAGWQTNQYAGMFIKVIAGSGFNTQQLPPAADNNLYPIAANTPTALTVVDDPNQSITTAPDLTTQYQIEQPTTVLHPNVQFSDGGLGTDGVAETVNVSNVQGFGANNSIAGFNQGTLAMLEIRYVRMVQPYEHSALGVHSSNVRLWGVQIQDSAASAQGANYADNSVVEVLRSSVVNTGGTARGAIDWQSVRFGSMVEGSYISGAGNGFELEGGGTQAWMHGAYVLGGTAAAILLIGPQYLRIDGNTYATSTSGAALQTQRGAIARIGAVFANANPGNSGTWGVNCSTGPGAIFISASTTATGTTGNATDDGVNTTTYTTIRGNSPPLIFGGGGCYVGQQ